jgi:hypothetical protein
VKEGRLDAVIVVPVDFEDRYLAGDSAKVEIVYDDSRTEAAPAIRQAERLLRAFNQETGTLRLVARGVSPDLATPLKVEHVNTATPAQKGAFLLFIIPMFACSRPSWAAWTSAIDSTAGRARARIARAAAREPGADRACRRGQVARRRGRSPPSSRSSRFRRFLVASTLYCEPASSRRSWPSDSRARALHRARCCRSPR